MLMASFTVEKFSLDRLREIARQTGRSVAQVSVNWTIHQPGITAALCGAKRAGQIIETSDAMHWRLDDEHFRQIEAALEERAAAGRAHKISPSRT